MTQAALKDGPFRDELGWAVQFRGRDVEVRLSRASEAGRLFEHLERLAAHPRPRPKPQPTIRPRRW